MSMSATERQNHLLVYLRKYIGDHDTAPSFDEMQEHMRLSSKSGIHRMLQGLEERGLIRRLHRRPRAIEILTTARDMDADRVLRFLRSAGVTVSGENVSDREITDIIREALR